MALIFANFKNYSSAKSATHSLIEQGIPAESISALMKLRTKNGTNSHGSANSAFLDSLLKGISQVCFPETGEMLAAGQLAGELATSVPLTTHGSLEAALKSFLPQIAASSYLDTLCSGGVLIWVNSDNKSALIEQIFLNENGKQIVTLE